MNLDHVSIGSSVVVRDGENSREGTARGSKIWEITGGPVGRPYGLVRTDDGGYIVPGIVASLGVGNDDFYVLKIRDEEITIPEPGPLQGILIFWVMVGSDLGIKQEGCVRDEARGFLIARCPVILELPLCQSTRGRLSLHSPPCRKS